MAGTRSRVTLKECERLLNEAKICATAMQGLAELEGNNVMKIREASQRLERDIAPLAKEVQRALGSEQEQQQERQRQELFYQAPNVDGNNNNNNNNNEDMEALISSSEDLLRQSMSLMVETETIGNSTIQQMVQQREQLQNARTNIDRTREIAEQAATVLRDMSRRAFRNKQCLYVMIGLLGIANVMALIHNFRK